MDKRSHLRPGPRTGALQGIRWGDPKQWIDVLIGASLSGGFGFEVRNPPVTLADRREHPKR